MPKITFNEKVSQLRKELDVLKQTNPPLNPEYRTTPHLQSSLDLANNITEFATYLENLGSETTTLDELEAAYEHPIIISHNGYTLQVPFSAPLYHSLVSLVNTAKEDF